MERYTWIDGKIRLRLTEEELMEHGLSRESLLQFDQKTQDALKALILSLQSGDVLPGGDLLAEVFPGRRGVVLQITSEYTGSYYYLPRTDDMLAVFPLAKALGAKLYRRLDGKGYYLAHVDKNKAVLFTEFALPCRVSGGVLKETCRRIL